MKLEKYRACERGTSLFKENGLKWLHIYPDSYEKGMLNIGFQIIWQFLNSIPGISCERGFFSPSRLSVETERRMSEFKVISFSLSYESMFPNFVEMLIKEQIEPIGLKRDYPLILGGGFSPTYNPELIAPVADVIFIGDNLNTLRKVAEIIREGIKRGEKKKKILEKMVKIKGVYLPSFYSHPSNKLPRRKDARVPCRVKKETSNSFCPSLPFIISPRSEWPEFGFLEISRGCNFRCNFCVLSCCHFPQRFKPLSTICREAKRMRKTTPYVRLVSPSEFMHPSILSILRYLKLRMKFKKVIVGSQRPDYVKKELIKFIDNDVFTLAPETHEKLRFKIGKHVSDKCFIKSIKLVASLPTVKKIRCFIMVGFPGEKENDRRNLRAFLEKLGNVIQGYGKEFEISINSHMKMPHTPFQWDAQERWETYKERIDELNGLGEIKRMEKDQIEVVGVMERGDFKVGEAVIEWVKKGRGLRRWYSILNSLGGVERFFQKRDEKELQPWEISCLVPRKELIEKRRIYFTQV